MFSFAFSYIDGIPQSLLGSVAPLLHTSRNNHAVAAKVYFTRSFGVFSIASGCLIAVSSNTPYVVCMGSRGKVHQAASPPVAVLQALRI